MYVPVDAKEVCVDVRRHTFSVHLCVHEHGSVKEKHNVYCILFKI